MMQLASARMTRTVSEGMLHPPPSIQPRRLSATDRLLASNPSAQKEFPPELLFKIMAEATPDSRAAMAKAGRPMLSNFHAFTDSVLNRFARNHSSLTVRSPAIVDDGATIAYADIGQAFTHANAAGRSTDLQAMVDTVATYDDLATLSIATDSLCSRFPDLDGSTQRYAIRRFAGILDQAARFVALARLIPALPKADLQAVWLMASAINNTQDDDYFDSLADRYNKVTSSHIGE